MGPLSFLRIFQEVHFSTTFEIIKIKTLNYFGQSKGDFFSLKFEVSDILREIFSVENLGGVLPFPQLLCVLELLYLKHLVLCSVSARFSVNYVSYFH